MKSLDIYTYSIGELNIPGTSVWVSLISYKSIDRMLSGTAYHTDKNMAELYSIYAALKALKEPCEVHIYSDSQFITSAYNLNWISKYESRGWMLHKTDPVPHSDIWKALMPLLRLHTVTFTWVQKTDVSPKMQLCRNKAEEIYHEIRKDKVS